MDFREILAADIVRAQSMDVPARPQPTETEKRDNLREAATQIAYKLGQAGVEIDFRASNLRDEQGWKLGGLELERESRIPPGESTTEWTTYTNQRFLSTTGTLRRQWRGNIMTLRNNQAFPIDKVSAELGALVHKYGAVLLG